MFILSLTRSIEFDLQREREFRLTEREKNSIDIFHFRTIRRKSSMNLKWKIKVYIEKSYFFREIKDRVSENYGEINLTHDFRLDIYKNELLELFLLV